VCGYPYGGESRPVKVSTQGSVTHSFLVLYLGVLSDV